MSKGIQIGRLAFRVEGEYWNCYWADADTMQDARLLGSIRMILVENEKNKERFMQLMRECFAYIIKDLSGADIDHWGGPTPAPESERTKE